MGPLWEQLESEAPWLYQELGFKTVYSDYSAKSFGDSIAILESAELRLRFVRDRGQLSCEVGSLDAPAAWWGLGDVRDVVQRGAPDQNSIPAWSVDLGPFLGFLRNEWPALIDCFSNHWPEARTELVARKAERIERNQRELAFRNPVRAAGPGRWSRFWSTRWHRLLGATKLDPFSRTMRKIFRRANAAANRDSHQKSGPTEGSQH